MIHLVAVHRIHNLNRPNRFQSLKDINLQVGAGELAVLSGVSGSGKTTLLSIIGALDKPTSGDVVVDGQQVAKLPDKHASAFRARTIGVIFQNHNLFDELSVHDNVAVPLVPAGLSQKEVDDRTLTAMKLTGIEHKADQKVRDLSGGEKQRCAIARALVGDPKVILCDEPTANLDRQNALKFIRILQDLKKLGKTIVVATHDPLFAELDFVDQRLKIADGSLVTP